MIVLVVGGGGREHAICTALKKSPLVTALHAAPGNGGISEIATCHAVKATDIDGMVSLAKEIKADYVFVAPDDPLVLGMVDEMEKAGFRTFGPRKNAAIIEGSKVFSKEFMKRHSIPTASYETFTDPDKAISYIREQNTFPTVIKCDGLALGKGVIIAGDIAEAEKAVHSMLVDGKFGDSGKEIVIEEYLTGPEVTVLAFTDGESILPCVASTDHKRAFDNDEGLNTGGMGVIAPTPHYTAEHAEETMQSIMLPTIRGLADEGRRFKGCIYFGLMLTPKGVRVIEYNCRFGDPETQVILPLLETDLAQIMVAIADEHLSEIDIQWKKEAAACVVMASGGYPESYQTGYEITGLDSISDTAVVYHAGTSKKDGKFYTAGGRVLGITGFGENLSAAIENAYRGVANIGFTNAHFRHDIGKKALSKPTT